MDPDFEAAFSNEYPEAYGETVRQQRRRNSGAATDSTLGIHVPVIPTLVSRLLAGSIVLTILIGGFFFFTGSAADGKAGIPSGPTPGKNSSSGLSGYELKNTFANLSEKAEPLREVGKGFQRGFDLR